MKSTKANAYIFLSNISKMANYFSSQGLQWYADMFYMYNQHFVSQISINEPHSSIIKYA